MKLKKIFAFFAIMEQQDYRAICGQFATGITIITTTHNGKPYGFTANSFASVSLEPAIVLFCLKTASETNAAFQASKTFAVNILSEKQEAVSNAFASSKNSQETRFEQVELLSSSDPVIKGGLGYLMGDIINFKEVGDHIVYYGKVIDGKRFEGNPLLYAKGGYQRLG
ncbi:MAG: flavin reductase [Flavobacteriaceae bacterium]|nr:flavin reductase [Flavobacteriaceae bacterium]|tara:strand:+ start:1228 stop:1731 length:504 start_codon:yes stop_codon:yes gene_type:complete